MLFLLVLMSANAACETQGRCHQFKVISGKRSKLTNTFFKVVVDLLEFVVIKVLFKAISGKFISKLLFPVKYDMINSCKIFYIRIFYILYSMIYILYKLWAKSIHDCMNKNLKCWKTRGAQHVSKALLNLSEFFFGGESVGGGVYTSTWRFF